MLLTYREEGQSKHNIKMCMPVGVEKSKQIDANTISIISFSLRIWNPYESTQNTIPI